MHTNIERYLETQRKKAQISRDQHTGSEAVLRVYEAAFDWEIINEPVMNPTNRKKLVEFLHDENTGLGLYFRAKHVFGYDLMEEEPHLAMCAFWYRKELDRLQKEPRGVFKTSIGCAFITGYILDNPNHAVALGSYTKDRAAEVGEEIRGLLASPVVSHFWGMQKGQPWRGDRLIIGKRTRPRKEGNLQVFGPDAPITGGHYDVIVWDDPHDASTLSDKMKSKAWDTYKELQVIRRKWAPLHIIMTRWAFDDVAGRVMEDQGVEVVIPDHDLSIEVSNGNLAVRMARSDTDN